jgi:hypothetical protein
MSIVQCCHTRTPTAILTPQFDTDGKLVAVRNTSNYDEMPFTDTTQRSVQWLLRRNGFQIIERTNFMRVETVLPFGKAGSNFDLLQLTNGDEELREYIKRPPHKLIPKPTDFFEVAINIENGNMERSQISNWVLIPFYAASDCCGGNVYQLLINGVLTCWKTQTGDCYTPQ